ncbi:hypothetical protein GGQ63_001910 [Prosthecomicrobium pneumaticum]|uniref:Uncharacterized protein n=1 Tax=Prosthecomicrobium pneumaticum TaxID=81895 RepID=A0A7W9L1M4_9HYPH|nr:hypothetical protein [Prosthecomicrobium pneumaticum]
MPSYRRGRPAGKGGSTAGWSARPLPARTPAGLQGRSHGCFGVFRVGGCGGRLRARGPAPRFGGRVGRPPGLRAPGLLAAQPGSWRRGRALGGAAGGRSRASRRGGGSPAAPRDDYGPRHRGRGDDRSGSGGRTAPPPAMATCAAITPAPCPPTGMTACAALSHRHAGLRRPLRPSCRPQVPASIIGPVGVPGGRAPSVGALPRGAVPLAGKPAAVSGAGEAPGFPAARSAAFGQRRSRGNGDRGRPFPASRRPQAAGDRAGPRFRAVGAGTARRCRGAAFRAPKWRRIPLRSLGPKRRPPAAARTE